MEIFRKTKSLQIILEAFAHSNHALSVAELVKQFKEDMNKTTVYRILERLEKTGFLHSFTGKDGLRWVARCKDEYASNHTTNHPHFQCQECGKSECLTIDISIPPVPNHKVISANLLLIGQCEDCLY